MAKIESDNGDVDINMNGNAWENVIDIEDDMMKKSANDVVDTARKAFVAGKSRSLNFRKDQLKRFLVFLEEEKDGMVKALHKVSALIVLIIFKLRLTYRFGWFVM